MLDEELFFFLCFSIPLRLVLLDDHYTGCLAWRSVFLKLLWSGYKVLGRRYDCLAFLGGHCLITDIISRFFLVT
jgi:hypothetical protein